MRKKLELSQLPRKKSLKFEYDPAKSTWHTIKELIEIGRETGNEGPMAHHLVGANLELQFPEVDVLTRPYSSADDQIGQPGDFQIGDTAFHITVSPMAAVYDKCKKNIADGLRVYLLVPDRNLIGSRQNAEGLMPGRITVKSLEDFISQNIEELSFFNNHHLITGLRSLLEIYNKRVDAVENDKSLLIEIPPNLFL